MSKVLTKMTNKHLVFDLTSQAWLGFRNHCSSHQRFFFKSSLAQKQKALLLL